MSSAHLGLVLRDRSAALSPRSVLWKEGVDARLGRVARGVVARGRDQTCQVRAHGLNAVRDFLDGVDVLGRHLHGATRARIRRGRRACRAEQPRRRGR